MTIRAALAATGSRRALYLLVASVGSGVLVGLLPSMAMKVSAIVGIGGSLVAIELTRRGRVLDPAWVIVAQLYLFVPIGRFLATAGLDVSVIALLNLAFVPFVAAAIVYRGASRKAILVVAPIALLGLAAAASTTWSSEAAYGAEKLSIFLVNGLIPAASIVALYAATGHVSWPLIAAFAFAYASALIVVGSGWDEDPTRRTLFEQNPILAGRAAMSGAIVALFAPISTVAKILMAPIMIIAGLLTMSLGPIIGLAMGIIAGIAGALRIAGRQGRRTALGWTALVLSLGFGCIALLSGALDAAIAQVLEDPNVTSRADYLVTSATLVASSPVFGIGFGSFLSTGLDQYPHNLFVEILVELGLIGAVLIIAWTVLALWGAVGSPLVLALVVSAGVFTLFSGNLASQTEFWMFSALAVAMLQASRATERRRTRSILSLPINERGAHGREL